MGACSDTVVGTTRDRTRWLGPPQMYPKGVELFRQGETLTGVMHLRSGLVKVVCTELSGHESILGLVFPGEWLGAAAVIAERPTPVSAVTCDHARIERVPADAFRDRLRQDVELSWEIHRRHAIELCRQSGWIGQLSLLGARQRLEVVLRRLIGALPPQRSQSGVRLDLPLHHWELARLVGISPEHFSRLLSEMQQEGIIHRAKGWIVVSDVRRLNAGCDPDDMGAIHGE